MMLSFEVEIEGRVTGVAFVADFTTFSCHHSIQSVGLVDLGTVDRCLIANILFLL